MCGREEERNEGQVQHSEGVKLVQSVSFTLEHNAMTGDTF